LKRVTISDSQTSVVHCYILRSWLQAVDSGHLSV